MKPTLKSWIKLNFHCRFRLPWHIPCKEYVNDNLSEIYCDTCKWGKGRGGNMEFAKITEKVLDIVREQLGSEKATLSDGLVEDLGADDLDLVELTMALEEEFGVEIPDEDAEKFNKVIDIADFLNKKIN